MIGKGKTRFRFLGRKKQKKRRWTPGSPFQAFRWWGRLVVDYSQSFVFILTSKWFRFTEFFTIICFLKTGGGLSSRWEEDKRKFCSQSSNGPFSSMTSFYCYDQNPSGFCFLVQIRASLSCYLRFSKTGNKKRPACFATLLQNELNSDAVRFTTTQCNKVPRAFPLKNGWGGKSKPSRLPWDRQTPSLFNRSWSCIEMGIEVH